MTNHARGITTSFLLIVACAIAGCSNAVAPQPPAGQAPVAEGAAAIPPGLPDLAMNVIIQKGSREDYQTESVKSFPNPTPAQIEEQVRAQDWKDPQRWPSIGLGRVTKNQFRTLRLEGVLGAPDPEVALRAKWIGVEGETEFLRRSPPLESLDAAIPLLLAFHNQDPTLMTLTEWTLVATE